jgi:carboxymethylenebutenolidase
MCFDHESEGCGLDRRDFLIGSAAAFAGLSALGAEGAVQKKEQPATRVLDDPDIQHGKVIFKHGGKETFDGYLARPKADGTFPAVLVIAGNRISEEYIPNTCAALALAGFVGLAPNTFHPLPDTAKTEEDYEKALKEHTKYDVLQDIQVAADYLKTQPFVKVRRGSEMRDANQPGWARGMGILGFCFGGRMAMLFAARSREIDAVVAFHLGLVMTDREIIAHLQVPVQLHQGTADQSVDPTTATKLQEILKAQKTPVELFLYEEADHGFLAYTRQFYRPDDAKLAWKRTTEFLGKHLKEK